LIIEGVVLSGGNTPLAICWHLCRSTGASAPEPQCRDSGPRPRSAACRVRRRAYSLVLPHAARYRIRTRHRNRTHAERNAWPACADRNRGTPHTRRVRTGSMDSARLQRLRPPPAAGRGPEPVLRSRARHLGRRRSPALVCTLSAPALPAAGDHRRCRRCADVGPQRVLHIPRQDTIAKKSPAAVSLAKLLGPQGRYAIYNPAQSSPKGLGGTILALGPYSLGILHQLQSVQGYSSAVSASYERATGAHEAENLQQPALRTRPLTS